MEMMRGLAGSTWCVISDAGWDCGVHTPWEGVFVLFASGGSEHELPSALKCGCRWYPCTCLSQGGSSVWRRGPRLRLEA